MEFEWDSEKEGKVSAAEITPQYGYGSLGVGITDGPGCAEGDGTFW
jgi:hypothetical protein